MGLGGQSRKGVGYAPITSARPLDKSGSLQEASCAALAVKSAGQGSTAETVARYVDKDVLPDS